MFTALLGPFLALHLFTAQAINTEVMQAQLVYDSPVQSPRYVRITLKDKFQNDQQS